MSFSGITARVVAPVPWFPFKSERFGAYGVLARVPDHEVRHGIQVSHPRFPAIPKIGMTAAPFLLYAAMRKVVRDLCRKEGSFDLIDAHYFYPDGVAAALLARDLGLPLTITARGTDINLIPRHPVARQLITWAATRADGLITVCQALKDELIRLGIDPEKVRVLRNGVDLNGFRPLPREAMRAPFAASGPILLSVGGLVPRKRHDLVIRAMLALPEATLLIVGEGTERDALARLARDLGVADRVRLLGPVPHARMAEIYSAGDILILASTREGWPNVLLEAMACGTPAIATPVWGAPEVITQPAAGRLLPDATPEALAASVRDLLADRPDPGQTRAYAEGFSWDATSRGQIEVFSGVLARRLAGSRSDAQAVVSA
jgi:glycosyltransferase involved in cell wall biosynthesis